MSLEFEYRQLAAACLDLVKRAAAPADKTRLLAIAEAWLKLVDRVSRRAGNAKRRNGDRTDYPAGYRPHTSSFSREQAGVANGSAPVGRLSEPGVVRHRLANSSFAAERSVLADRFDFPRRQF